MGVSGATIGIDPADSGRTFAELKERAAEAAQQRLLGVPHRP